MLKHPHDQKQALEKELHRSQGLLKQIEANMSPAELHTARCAFERKLERARAAKFS
jgi:hypothetical protein